MSRILVIEDDLTVAKVVETVLSLEGHEVTVARDVSEGRAAIEGGAHAVIVLDVTLPKGTGLDLLRELRTDLALDTPVIILSGLTQEGTVVRALELGANDYVTKPFSPRELIARINRWTGGRGDVASIRG